MNEQLMNSKEFLTKYHHLVEKKAQWADADRARYSKIAGSLFAGALGDALGYAVEFESWTIIRKKYGDSGIQNLSLGANGKAIISDDTQMTLFTCEGMVLGRQRALGRGVPASVEDCIYDSYLNWMQTQGYACESPWDRDSMLKNVRELHFRRLPGLTCLSALSDSQRGSVEAPINDSKGCGGVMRTAPLGYTKAWGNDVMRNGAQVAALTHGHPGGWIPGGVLSDMVYQMIYEEPKPLKETVLVSLERAKAHWGTLAECVDFLSLMHQAVELAETDLPDRDAFDLLSSNPQKGGGWTGDEALAIAVLCCLRYPDDIPACLRAAVNHSGDSDSTGAIAGNILGAYLGFERIPGDWMDNLELTEVIEAFAVSMTDMDRV